MSYGADVYFGLSMKGFTFTAHFLLIHKHS
jgi:hypothetical protein